MGREKKQQTKQNNNKKLFKRCSILHVVKLFLIFKSIEHLGYGCIL